MLKLVRAACALTALTMMSAGCGRTATYSGDGGVVTPDQGRPDSQPADTSPRRDRGWTIDSAPWPTDTAWPRPDFGWPPDSRPPADFGWPPLDGPRPDIHWPEFGLPDFGLPDFGWPDITWPPTDGGLPDLPPNCSPSCDEICGLAGLCVILDHAVCLQQCAVATPTLYRCLSNAYCDRGPNQCGLMKECFVPAQPDLQITRFAPVVTYPSPNENQVSLPFTVCNNGNAPAGAFWVDLYLDRPFGPTPGGSGDMQRRLQPLGVKQCQSYSFVRDNVPPKTYYSWLQVDARNEVRESNESNNIAGPRIYRVDSSQQAPDLRIESFTTSVQGTTLPYVRYRVSVCNRGSQRAGPHAIHVYYNQPTAPGPGTNGDQLTNLNGLAPGQCTSRTITRTGAPAGTFTSWAQVDPENTVIESDEANNVAGPQTVTVGSTAGADLEISTLTATLDGLNRIRYSARICNVGSGSAGATQLHVYFNRTNAPARGEPGDQTTTTSQLAPGQCINRTIRRTGVPSGTYTSWGQVDPFDTVKETNEANNVRGPVSVTVPSSAEKPDLRIQSFNVTAAGSTVTYSMRVCNDGRNIATSSLVDVYYNAALPPNASQAGNRRVSAGQLAPGVCVSRTTRRFGTPAGSYTAWARIDRRNSVAESDENNNLAGPRRVQVGTTQLSCTGVCTVAITCGLFSPVQLRSCLDWCNAAPSSARSCLSDAGRKNDCGAMRQCAPLPPPPPPPPPGTCKSICDWFDASCNMIPIGTSCTNLCSGFAPDQITCVQAAQQKNACMEAVLCIL